MTSHVRQCERGFVISDCLVLCINRVCVCSDYQAEPDYPQLPGDGGSDHTRSSRRHLGSRAGNKHNVLVTSADNEHHAST